MPAILALGRLTHKYREFKANLGYLANLQTSLGCRVELYQTNKQNKARWERARTPHPSDQFLSGSAFCVVLLPETPGPHPRMPSVLLGTMLTSPDSKVSRGPTVFIRSLCPAIPTVTALVLIAKAWPVSAHCSIPLQGA